MIPPSDLDMFSRSTIKQKGRSKRNRYWMPALHWGDNHSKFIFFCKFSYSKILPHDYFFSFSSLFPKINVSRLNLRPSMTVRKWQKALKAVASGLRFQMTLSLWEFTFSISDHFILKIRVLCFPRVITVSWFIKYLILSMILEFLITLQSRIQEPNLLQL